MVTETNPILLFKEKTWGGFVDIKSRQDLSVEEKVEKFIQLCSREAAAMGSQPNPDCVDIYLFGQIQVYITERLGDLRGEQVPANEIVVNLTRVVGMDILHGQAQSGLYKEGLASTRVFSVIHLIYGLTYSVGKVLDYFVLNKEACTPKEVKTVWENAYSVGKEQGYSIDLEGLSK